MLHLHAFYDFSISRVAHVELIASLEYTQNIGRVYHFAIFVQAGV